MMKKMAACDQPLNGRAARLALNVRQNRSATKWDRQMSAAE
jgi:hypothetical protein